HRAGVPGRVHAARAGAGRVRGREPAAPVTAASVETPSRRAGRAFVLGVGSLDHVAAGPVGLLAVLDRQARRTRARARAVAADPVDAVSRQALLAGTAGRPVRRP